MTPYLINLCFTHPDGQEGGFNEIRVDADIESAMKYVLEEIKNKLQECKITEISCKPFCEEHKAKAIDFLDKSITFIEGYQGLSSKEKSSALEYLRNEKVFIGSLRLP